jgi:hypothetical protein
MTDESTSIDTGTNELLCSVRDSCQRPRQCLGCVKDNLDLALSADFLTSLDHEVENRTLSSNPKHCFAASTQHIPTSKSLIEFGRCRSAAFRLVEMRKRTFT